MKSASALSNSQNTVAAPPPNVSSVPLSNSSSHTNRKNPSSAPSTSAISSATSPTIQNRSANSSPSSRPPHARKTTCANFGSGIHCTREEERLLLLVQLLVPT